MLKHVTAVAVLIAAASHGGAAAESPREADSQRTRFASETSLISIDVTVTDRRGRPVEGLRKEDFAVFDDGVEQAVSFFSHENRPISWALVLDKSGSMSTMMEDVYRAALHSIEAGTAEDDVLVLTFNNDVDLLQDFTSDRAMLLKSIRSLRATGMTALYDAVALGLDRVRRGRHEKKVLVLVTDGDDNASHLRFSRLLDVAQDSRTLIYPVGLLASMEGSVAGLISERSRAELEQLAEISGGMAYFPKDMKQCERACRDIAQQVSRQYSLGYYPDNRNWDGRWRTIAVKLRTGNEQGVVVRTRSGYYGRPVNSHAPGKETPASSSISTFRNGNRE